jgi:hypothetical protein
LKVRMVRALASRSFDVRVFKDAVACGRAAVNRDSCERTNLALDSASDGLTDQPLTRPGAFTSQQRDATRRAVRGGSAAGPSNGARSGAAAS